MEKRKKEWTDTEWTDAEWKRLEEEAREAGFRYSAYLDCATIELLEEVRKMCGANTCGQYERNWSCPPGCGSLVALREQVSGFRHGILVQTVGELEDSLDFEGMQEAEQRHKQAFLKLTESLRQTYPGLLPLGTGCCTLCQSCTYPEQPCRFPKKRISSMEAYGILVSDLCAKNQMSYYYGPNKVAYTACLLLT